jgi:hypothetical protein
VNFTFAGIRPTVVRPFRPAEIVGTRFAFATVCGSIPIVTIQYTHELSGNGLKSRRSELQNSFDPYLIQDEYLAAQQIQFELMTF